MSMSVINCPSCNAQNISTAQFCGSCGTKLVTSTAANSQLSSATTTSGGGQSGASVANQQWNEKVGLICGVVSIIGCGIVASLPGIYFSWTAMNEAKRNGQSPSLSYVALALNIAGIVLMCVGVAAVLFFTMMAGASAGTGFEYGQPDPFAF